MLIIRINDILYIITETKESIFWFTVLYWCEYSAWHLDYTACT